MRAPLVLLAPLLVLSLSAAPFQSPDGRLEADVRLGSDGAPVYELKLEGRPVLRPSRLGLVLDDADFTREGADVVMRNPGVRRTSRYLQLARESGVPAEKYEKKNGRYERPRIGCP